MTDNFSDVEVSQRRSSSVPGSPTRSPTRRSGPSWADLSDVLETLGDREVLPRALPLEEAPEEQEVGELPERTPSEGPSEVGQLPEATPSEGPSEVDPYEPYHGIVADSFGQLPSAPSSPSRLSPHAQEFTPGNSSNEFSPVPASPSAPRLALLSTTPIAKASPKLSANAPPFQPGAPAATLAGDVSPQRARFNAQQGTHHAAPTTNAQAPPFPSVGVDGVWNSAATPPPPQVQSYMHGPPGSVAPLLPGAARAPRMAAPLQRAPGAMELEALATAISPGTGSSTSSRPPQDGNQNNGAAGFASTVVDPRTLRPPPYAAHGQQMPATSVRPPPSYFPGHRKTVDSEAKEDFHSGYRGQGGPFGSGKQDQRQDRRMQEGRERWAPRIGAAYSSSEVSADTSWRSENEASSNSTNRDRPATHHRAVDSAWWNENEWWDESSASWNGRSDAWESRRPPTRQKPPRWENDDSWKKDSTWEAPDREPHRGRFARRSEEPQEPQKASEPQRGPSEKQERSAEDTRPKGGWAGVNTAAFRRLAEGHLMGRGGAR